MYIGQFTYLQVLVVKLFTIQIPEFAIGASNTEWIRIIGNFEVVKFDINLG